MGGIVTAGVGLWNKGQGRSNFRIPKEAGDDASDCGPRCMDRQVIASRFPGTTAVGVGRRVFPGRYPGYSWEMGFFAEDSQVECHREGLGKRE